MWRRERLQGVSVGRNGPSVLRVGKTMPGRLSFAFEKGAVPGVGGAVREESLRGVLLLLSNMEAAQEPSVPARATACSDRQAHPQSRTPHRPHPDTSVSDFTPFPPPHPRSRPRCCTGGCVSGSRMFGHGSQMRKRHAAARDGAFVRLLANLRRKGRRPRRRSLRGAHPAASRPP